MPHSPTPSENVETQVRSDQLQLLFRQSSPATIGSLGGAIALAVLQYDLGNKEVITPWLITLCLAVLIRLSLFWTYNHCAPHKRTSSYWVTAYWSTLIFTAGSWGIGAFLLMAKDDLLSQAITLFFVTGLCGSAISSYSAYRAMTLTAIALVLLPTTLWLLLDEGNTQRLLAISALAFAIFVLRATRELSHALISLIKLRRELEIEHRIASDAARTDELTGLNNLRAFKEQADTMFAYTRRHDLPLSALMVDIDYFKQINDTHGHAAGDQVLQAVAKQIKTTLREADICGRLGGEEFGVMLAGTSLHEALQIAEKLRTSIESIEVPIKDTRLHVTISVGVAEANTESTDTTILLAQADAAMYHAKAKGRNRVNLSPNNSPA